MPERNDQEELRQLAAEMVLATSSLHDELTDEEARPLIAWGLAQAEAAAAEMAATSQATGGQLSDDLGPVLADRLTPLRRTMKAINRLAADRHGFSGEEFQEEVQYLLELAGGLPHPPAQAGTTDPLPGWALRQAELDNAAFVQAILAFLAPDSATQGDVPDPATHTGGEGAEQEADYDGATLGRDGCGHAVGPAPPGSLPVAGQGHPAPGPV